MASTCSTMLSAQCIRPPGVSSAGSTAATTSAPCRAEPHKHGRECTAGFRRFIVWRLAQARKPEKTCNQGQNAEPHWCTALTRHIARCRFDIRSLRNWQHHPIHTPRALCHSPAQQAGYFYQHTAHVRTVHPVLHHRLRGAGAPACVRQASVASAAAAGMGTAARRYAAATAADTASTVSRPDCQRAGPTAAPWAAQARPCCVRRRPTRTSRPP